MPNSLRLYGLSMGFSRQEYWSGLPGHLADPGMEPAPLTSAAQAGEFFAARVTRSPHEAVWKPHPCLGSAASVFCTLSYVYEV